MTMVNMTQVMNLFSKIQDLIDDSDYEVQTEALCRVLGAVIVTNNRDYKSCEDLLDKFTMELKNLMKEASDTIHELRL